MYDLLVMLVILIWSMVVIMLQNTFIMPKMAYESFSYYFWSCFIVSGGWVVGLYLILFFFGVLG